MKPISEIKINRSQIQQLSTNLSALMRDRGVSENDLAKILNLPVMTVRRLVTGETADPRISTLKLIADYFDIAIDYLLQRDVGLHMLNISTKLQPQFIPVIDWEIIKHINSVEELDKNKLKNWQPIQTKNNHVFGPHSFALPSKPTMQPRFPIGTLFIIDPSEKPMDGDLIIIKIKTGEASLRELVIDPPNQILRTIVQGSESIIFDESEHHILGVVMLTLLHNRLS